MDVSGFNESGYNRQVTKVGGSMSARWQQHARDWRWVLCAVKRNHGRKEVLKHPTETNTAIQYGLFGCINHEATRKSTYEAILKCDRIGYVDSVPLPWPPSPQSQHSLPFPDLLHFKYCSSTVTPAFLFQNVVCLNEGFIPYPCCLYIKIT